MKKLLIANRGEIAERVRRTAEDMGIRTVAIYSDADADMPIVTRADEAVALGGISPAESYLDVDKVLDAAKSTSADAVHPGYGFLSENAEFARRVVDAGLIWVGPSPDAIDAMGDKARAKRAMIEAGVLCIPGYQQDNASYKQLMAASAEIGFPLMVKAAAGGGGRGMRRVDAPVDLADAIASARSEAENAFGSGELILERLVENARHVEVQVFGDSHGNIIHLGERDCSVQRRHQKVIEEAPSPAVDDALRAKMGEAAVRAAKAVDYVGAGTVEFLLAEDGAFYFLEMNTRLQVEHPVTEEVTSLDLVELQLRVARGEPLGLEQDDVQFIGHSIEARLYAEDPANGFLPQAGTVQSYLTSYMARHDTGLHTDIEGPQDVPSAYDPMIAKVIVHGEDRDAAVMKLDAALSDTLVAGLTTNRDFLLQILRTETFRAGEATTNWLDSGGVVASPASPSKRDLQAVAVILHYLRSREALIANSSPELAGWSNWSGLATPYRFKVGEAVERISVSGDIGEYVLDGDTVAHVTGMGLGRANIVIDGHDWSAPYARHGRDIFVGTTEGTYAVQDISGGEISEEDGAGSGIIRAPMHGALLSVDVAEGDVVEDGQRLGTLEAMKMQHPLRADVSGVVKRVSATAGSQVASGDVLLEIEVGEKN